jgi:dTDP-4-amino-4,6-dideoxygalactose transaminase
MSTSLASRTAIPFHAPWYDEREVEAFRSALNSGAVGGGPVTRAVERRLADLLGVPHVLLTTSCTHALELALLALGVHDGQEVVCPSFTFVSTANAALRVGARPVFAEIDKETLGLDPADVERRLTPRTAAIIPVHYAGIAPDMEALLELADRRGLRLVEDAAQGIGAAWRGRPLGTLGDAGTLSFHESKNVSCGEGGALVVRDPVIARMAEIVREKGTNRAAFFRGEVDKYTWVAEGSSYVLSDLLAAVLGAQLDKLDEIQRRRAHVDTRYREGLTEWAERCGVRLCPRLPDRASNHHIFYLVYPEGRLRDLALASLRARGVGATFHYVPLHSSPYGRQFAPDLELAVTESVAAGLLRLPLHPLLSESDIGRVVEAVRTTGSRS